MTQFSWAGRKPLTWDVMAVCLLATSYLDAAASNAGSATATAAERKTAKYADIGNQFLFQPIAIESLSPIHESAWQFLVDLGRKITDRSGMEHHWYFPRV